jgi:hypothetical protein
MRRAIDVDDRVDGVAGDWGLNHLVRRRFLDQALGLAA